VEEGRKSIHNVTFSQHSLDRREPSAPDAEGRQFISYSYFKCKTHFVIAIVKVIFSFYGVIYISFL
jgi:hypothetical protein